MKHAYNKGNTRSTVLNRCYTLELIQTVYALNGKENCVDFHNLVFPGEAKMCLDFMSFRAPDHFEFGSACTLM